MILPLSLLAALLSALLWRGQARAAAFATVLMALFLASWPPVAWVAAWTLEGRYHSAMPPAEAPPEAIVVLSGYMRENAWGGLPTPGLDTYERLTYAVTLHRHWPSTPIIVTGGRLSRRAWRAARLNRTGAGSAQYLRECPPNGGAARATQLTLYRSCSPRKPHAPSADGLSGPRP